MLNRISHIGVVVRDLDAALRFWRDALGLVQFAEADIAVEGIRSVFLSVSGAPGEMTIELMQPADQTDMANPVARRLAKAGEGVYHLAVVAGDVPAAAERLRALGLPVVERPAVEAGTAGRWLVHPKAATGVMVEGIAEWCDAATIARMQKPSA